MKALDVKIACLWVAILLLGAITFNPSLALAKGGDEQDQIILLNDSAAALDDSNLELSRGLTKFADEKELEWEKNNANKDLEPLPLTVKDVPGVEEHIKLLKLAAVAIEPSYPLIAKALRKMAKDMNKTIELLE